MSKSLDAELRDSVVTPSGAVAEKRLSVPNSYPVTCFPGTVVSEAMLSSKVRNRGSTAGTAAASNSLPFYDVARVDAAGALSGSVAIAAASEEGATALPLTPSDQRAILNDSLMHSFPGRPPLSPLDFGAASGGGGSELLLGVLSPVSKNPPALLRTITTLAAPISVSQVAQFSIMMFMLAAVGSIGVTEMGGASIGFGLINATAFAFSSGLCGALETLLSQSFGRDPNSKMFGVYTQRMLLVLALCAIPLSFCLAYVEPVLVWVGEPANVAAYAGRFCRTSSYIAVGPVMLLELLRRYYVSQRRPNPVFAAVVMAALANPFMVYPLVRWMGYDGVAVAFAVITGLMDVGLLLYLWVTGVHKQTWGGWSRAALRQWGPMLRLALPSLAMGLSEWTSLEANSVVAGFGTEAELAAYAVSSQIASLCWAVPSGVYMAATVLVGNSIGSGNTLLAKRFAKLTMGVAVALSVLNCGVVLCFSRGIAQLFTSDEAVIALFATRVAPSMLAYHLADTLSCNFLAILRGCGLHSIGMVIILSSLAVVGTPLGVILFLRFHYGVEALWIGPFLGYVLVGLPAYVYVLFYRLDWNTLKAAAEGEMLLAH